MKKFKAILALLLVASLFVCMFAACAQTEEPKTPSTSEKTPATETPKEEDKPATEEPTAPVEDEEPVEEEMTDLVFVYFDLRMKGADHGDRIEKAINEYINEAYNLNVDIVYYPIGDWMSKLQLGISSGEQIDVMQLGAGSDVVSLHSQNMLTDISSELKEYAPEALDLMGKYMSTYTFEDGVFGVPTYRGYLTNQYIIMRKDILEEMGMLEFAENMTSWTEYEQIMQAVKENYTDKGTGLWALSKNSGANCTPSALWDGDNFSDIYGWDTLLDPVNQILTDDEGHVSWLEADPRNAEKLARVATWADNGWIYPDSSLVDLHGDELMKQGISFSELDRSEHGIEAVKGQNCGHDVVCVKYQDGEIVTDTLTGWGIGCPITCEEPEGACRLINALYTDAKLMNLLTRGIEGEDYTVENGECVQGDNYYEADFLVGNNTLLLPLQGQGADYFEEIKKINEGAKIGTYLGFTMDRTDLTLIIGGLSAINDQYSKGLTCGQYTPEYYAEYMDKLEAAGVQEYISSVQDQLTAWLAANK